jgi:hypothetical protein
VSPTPAVAVSRAQILAFRRHASGLDEKLPHGPTAMRRAAWLGLQDSMPRAALLSLYARVAGIGSGAWEDPALVQLWGPRFSAYVVPRQDVGLFSVARMPESESGRRRALDMADRVVAFLDGRRLLATEIGRGLGINANAIRYAAPTGRLRIRWDGARQPTVWAVPAPRTTPEEARSRVARRFLRIFGPSTAPAFAQWAGIKPPVGEATFKALAGSLIPVRTPIGEAWILDEDEAALRTVRLDAAPHHVRLLPSGDTFFLLWGRARELVVPDATQRGRLWTTRVWPGALLIGDEITGTWRRAGGVVTVETWRRLSAAERAAVEDEAGTMPLPGLEAPIQVHWPD